MQVCHSTDDKCMVEASSLTSARTCVDILKDRIPITWTQKQMFLSLKNIGLGDLGHQDMDQQVFQMMT